MTGLVALDVFIGLIFIYLLYSLLATAILEFISAAFGMRARNLEWTIERMLSDQKEDSNKLFAVIRNLMRMLSRFISRSKTGLAESFFNQPDIKYMSEGGLFNKPSYIKPEIFSRALTESLKEISKKGKNDRGKISDAIENSNNSQINADTKKQLKILWNEASTDITKFRSLIEDWFDSVNERATGWYKRKIRVLLLIIGFAVAVFANVDSIAIVKKLSKDKTSREQMVQLATARMEAAQNGDSAGIAAAYQEVKDSLKVDIAKSNEILGMGWPENVSNRCILCAAMKSNGGLGYIITAFALSLGSTFWFDLLNKLVKLRSSVAVPTSSQQGGNSNNQKPKRSSGGTGSDVVPARIRKG